MLVSRRIPENFQQRIFQNRNGATSEYLIIKNINLGHFSIFRGRGEHWTVQYHNTLPARVI